MLENIRLSFQGVWSHRLRSFLTMLGIIIGIAAIIAIVSTIKGTNEQIKKNLIGSGTNTTTVQLTEEGNYPAEMEYGIPKGIPVLDDDMRQQLADIDHVKDASLYVSRTQVDYTFRWTAYRSRFPLSWDLWIHYEKRKRIYRQRL